MARHSIKYIGTFGQLKLLVDSAEAQGLTIPCTPSIRLHTDDEVS